MSEQISETEALKKVMREDPNCRGEDKFSKNLCVVKTLREMGVNVIINYRDLNKCSIDSILTIRRTIMKEYRKENFEPEENVSYERKE